MDRTRSKPKLKVRKTKNNNKVTRMSRKKSASPPQVNHPDPARVLINFLRMIMDPAIDSQTLIKYVEYFRIDPNTYLPSVREGIQMPLIYYCCSNPNLTDFFIYLLNHKVNLFAPMICENPEHQIELLYYSQVQFIPTLVEHGCKLNESMVPINGRKLLIKGNITKLMVLYKNKVISKDQLLAIINEPGLVFRVLDHLYERIYVMCQEVKDSTQLKRLIGETMKNYVNIFKLFFKNGVNVNQIEEGDTFLQRVLNTYFYELVALTVEYNPNFDRAEFLHYSNFDLTNRQVMSAVYNDENYQKIMDIIKDKVITLRIIKKRPVIRKTVSHN
jgi:hypothetical protein